MKKNYVLDTNILLHDPHAIFKFEDNTVVLPIHVLEEVDQFKKESTERGRNARTVARLLDDLRAKGSLSDGVATTEGGLLRVQVPKSRPRLDVAINPTSPDHMILQTALEVKAATPDLPTIFVTMDVNLRVRADALGLPSETYENQAVDVEELDTGTVEVTVDEAVFAQFAEQGTISPPAGAQVYANACVLLHDRSERPRTALGRYIADRNQIIALKVPREGVMGIKPRNLEQSFALDLLLDDSVRLVTLMGSAGTGKTLVAMAASLKRVLEDGTYTRVLVSRPVMPMGRDLGFLPGSMEDKLNPWMQPVFDNLEFLLMSGAGRQQRIRGYEELMDRGQLQVEPLTYIRGRSLPHQYVIVDEAQNLTPHEVKTIVTRCGEGTKIVLTGDPYQIDNPYVDASSNGLSFTAHRLRGEPLVGHVLLTKGERSALANVAAAKL
jgi:PhoH-like ATPase